MQSNLAIILERDQLNFKTMPDRLFVVETTDQDLRLGSKKDAKFVTRYANYAISSHTDSSVNFSNCSKKRDVFTQK